MFRWIKGKAENEKLHKEIALRLRNTLEEFTQAVAERDLLEEENVNYKLQAEESAQKITDLSCRLKDTWKALEASRAHGKEQFWNGVSVGACTVGLVCIILVLMS